MSLKSKLIAVVVAFCMVLAVLCVGVFALQVQTTDWGAEINFKAHYVDATISTATLTGVSHINSSDSSSKMQAVTIDENTTTENLPQNSAFYSWSGLRLKLNDGATEGTIAFTITNNNTDPDEYIEVDYNVTTAMEDNMGVGVTQTGSLVIAPNATSTTFTVKFEVFDEEIDANLLDFGISFDLKRIVPTNEADIPSYFTYTLNSPTGEATINKFTSTTETDVVVPALIKRTSDGQNFPVTTLGSLCFKSKTQLVSVELPNSIKELGQEAFYECTKLSSVNIPNGVTRLISSTFSKCTSLASIEIPYGITGLNGDFSDCTSLKSVEIPDTVTNIGPSSFYGCTTLESIKLSKNLTSISYFAFSNCSSLKSIVIPESVTSILNPHYGLISDCTSLESLTMPFLGASATDTTYNFLGSWFAGYSYSDNTTVVPESLKEVIVTGGTTIAASAFKGCANIERVVLPEGITEIPNDAFNGCTSLTDIEIPNGVAEIGEYSFANCSSLVNIVVPVSVTSFGDGVFARCTSLKALELSNGLNDVGLYAFAGCTSLENISLSFAAEIGEYAFIGCTSLKNLIIPFLGENKEATTKNTIAFLFGATNSGVAVEGKFFSGGVPSSLKQVTITKATTIATNAFKGCANIETINLPKEMTSIGGYAFSGCSKLKNITLPQGITSIPGYCFYTCDALESIEIPDSVLTIGTYAFYSCDLLDNVIIPDSVTSIETYAFGYCYALKDIKLSNTLRTIDEYAFQYCTALRRIVIPESVTFMGLYLFSYCTNFDIVMLSVAPPTISIIFANCTNFRIIVPDGYENVYKTASSWSGYQNYIY